MALFLVSTRTRDKGEVAISYSILIRLGGLVAIASGIASVTVWYLPRQSFGSIEVYYRVILIAGFVLPMVGAMATIVALYTLLRRRYGLRAALPPLTAFVGVALLLVDLVQHFV